MIPNLFDQVCEAIRRDMVYLGRVAFVLSVGVLTLLWWFS